MMNDTFAFVAAPSAPFDLNAERGIDMTVITWGDSVANFIGLNLKGVFNEVVNRGTNGAGLDNVIPPQELGDIPDGAVVLISMGGNDVEGMIGKPQSVIDDHAKRVVAVAEEARILGGTPIIIGHGVPPAPYTGPVPGGGASHWADPGFYENWVATMHKMNAAIKREAEAVGITWSEVESRIPREERSKDNLHYTVRGSRHIAANALKDAGIFKP